MGIDTVWVVVTIPTVKHEHHLNKQRYEYEEANNNNNNNANSLEWILTDALFQLKIADAVWVKTKSGLYHQVYFPVELVNNDYTFYYLRKQGIGSRGNSSLGFIPFSMYLYNDKVDDPLDYDRDYVDRLKDSFLRSVTARLTVAQVVDGVMLGSTPNFDFWMYMVTSSVIACMGIMNSAGADVNASMLIEPIMTCVICCAFGCSMHNWAIIRRGVRSLVWSQIFCILFGFGFGGIFLLWRVAWNPPPDGAWPTSEMQGRGEYKQLIYGSVIASAGGAALAVVVLQNNIMAMTGIAIATTFMPPLVNAGICWALAAHVQGSGIGEPWQTYNFSGEIYVLRDAYIPKGGYSPSWSYDIRVECLILGAISVAYHFINVFFLFSFGYLVLKMKFIIPLKFITPVEHKFFSQDIRAYQEHIERYSTDQDMGKRILEEWADIVGIDKNQLMSDTPEARATQLQTIYDIAREVEDNPSYQRLTRNAVGNRYQQQLRDRLAQSVLNGDGMNVTVQNDPNGTMQTLDVSAIDNSAFVRDDANDSIPNIRRSLRYSRGSLYSIWPSSNDPSAPMHRTQNVNNIRPIDVPSQIRNRSRSIISDALANKKDDF